MQQTFFLNTKWPPFSTYGAPFRVERGLKKTVDPTRKKFVTQIIVFRSFFYYPGYSATLAVVHRTHLRTAAF